MSTKSHGRKWDRLIAAASKPPGKSQLPFEWWIGRGQPLNPYLRGTIIEMLRKELKPKELRLIPNELSFEGERDNAEYTLVDNWMKMWLKWLLWYAQVALGPDPSIREMFEAPIVGTSWKRSNFDSNWFKFGLIWRCYDMGQGWTLSKTPPVLESMTIQFDRRILGGSSGTDFMMAPVDNQSTGSKR